MERLSELPIGTTVGDAYLLVRRIREGAQGTVYEARLLADHRRCAVKVLNDAVAQEPEALARFHSQAEFASRMMHPHLARVVDFGTAASGQPFLVMEYLQGEDLARRRERVGHFDPPFVSYIVKQAAIGLRALHDQGLLHLDLKPHNIFLASDQGEPDFVKLTDFGTAQIVNASLLGHASALEDTLPYIAPEQTSGRQIGLDGRSDQWALACIAWQLLTGRAPFLADDPTTLLYQIAFEDPTLTPPEGVVVAPGVIEVLRYGLAKRQDDRFSDIIEFAKAFEAAAGTLSAAQKRQLLQETAPGPAPGFAPGPQAPAPGSLAQAAPAMGANMLVPNSGPIFLPGMSRREQEPPRRPAGASKARRVQGLRVGGGTGVGPAVGPPAIPAAARGSNGRGRAAQGLIEIPSPPPDLRPSGAAKVLWSAMRNSTGGRSRWLWLAPVVPVIALVAVLVKGPPPRHEPPVDVDRAAQLPALPASPSPAPVGQGPVIVPLNQAAPPRPAVTERRRRRLRRAGLHPRIRAADARPRAKSTRRGHARAR